MDQKFIIENKAYGKNTFWADGEFFTTISHWTNLKERLSSITISRSQ